MGKPARVKNVRAIRDGEVLGRTPRVSAAPIPAKTVEQLHQAFEGLGLTPYQARVMLALLQAGPANCLDLARLASIPRTSIYQILDELDAKGVAIRLPGNGPAVWNSVGRDDVFTRLVALEEDRLSHLKDRSAQVAGMLDELLPEDRSSSSLPYVQVIHDPSRVRPLFEQLVGETEEELLVFNRPPYSMPIGSPKQVILDATRRTSARAIYQAAEADDPYYEAWHHEMQAYHEAGVKARVIDHLPIKLAVFDRKTSLLTLDDPVLAQVGFPTTMLVEHPGFATVQAAAFDDFWASATPYDEVHEEFEAWTQANLA